ncbi:MAG: hypothetical protein NC318_10055 [Blautia sp.]|nr:hypothetical protein [Lachnoclostridium sp.]MCM1211935.1 hypothetical protein [Blautia sp.]
MVKKEERYIRDRFLMSCQTVGIDNQKKEDTLSLLQIKIDEKKIGVLRDRKQILISQMRYMDKSTFAVHLLLCIVLLLFAGIMQFYKVEKEDVILFSMILSIVLAVVSIMGVGRIFGSGIAELGESCYFNVKQIVAFQFALSGIINLVVLSCGIFFIGLQWKINLLQIGLYILVPFIAAQCCCLRILLWELGRRNVYVLIMAGMFLMILQMILAQIPALYQITSLALWGIAFAAGVVLFGLQLKALFRGIEKGEMICMN